MSKRLARLFSLQRKKKIFSVFLTLGYTSLTHTEKLIRLAEQEGVDLIELGFPFSDPLADGPVIQASSQASLESGVVFQDGLELVSRLRKQGLQVPILFFSYYNVILNRGETRAARELAQAGFDGALIPDLPPEEGEGLSRTLKKSGLSLIYFLAPTSTPERMRFIAKKTGEFIYYVSSRGVTGVRKQLDPDLVKNLRQIRSLVRKPVLIGFGISDSRKVREASKISDGVIVGSALIKAVGEHGASPAGLKKTTQFLRRLKSGLL